MSNPSQERFAIPLIILASLFLLAGIAVFGFQCYLFLKYDEWVSISIAEGIVYLYAWTEPAQDAVLPALVTWAMAPTRWVGLHKVLLFIPSALALIGIGFGLNAWAQYLRSANK